MAELKPCPTCQSPYDEGEPSCQHCGELLTDSRESSPVSMNDEFESLADETEAHDEAHPIDGAHDHTYGNFVDTPFEGVNVAHLFASAEQATHTHEGSLGDEQTEATPMFPEHFFGHDTPTYQQSYDEPETTTAAPMPPPLPFTAKQAALTVYHARQPIKLYPIVHDETLLGRDDASSSHNLPDIDLAPFDEEKRVSKNHAIIYRQNRSYSLYVVSNAGTQINNDLLSLGERRSLKDGDVIILAGKVALKFSAP